MRKVTFEEENGQTLDLSFNLSASIREILMEYLNQKYSCFSFEHFYFMINGKPLPERILDQPIRRLRLIRPGSIIKVREKHDVYGGGGIITVDVSKNNTRIAEIDPRVKKGLNILSTCTKEKEAKNQKLYKPIGFVRDYDKDEVVICPFCSNYCYQKNFGFLNCKYKIYYTKWENGKKINGLVEGESEENQFKVFSESSGNAIFEKLIFDVSPK